MNNTSALIAAVTIILSLTLACSGHDTLKQNWGSSYGTVIENQTANPDASKNLDPVAGLDGPAAKKAVDRYQQGCKGREDDTTYNLRLGTIEGIGEKSQ